MTPHTALDRLWEQLLALHETLVNLWLSSAQDAPDPEEFIVVETLADEVESLKGLNQEAIAALRPTRREEVDLHTSRKALTTASDRVIAFDRQLAETERRRVPQVNQYGREHGQAWAAWAQIVTTGVERARNYLRECIAALLAGWRELAEQEELAITTLRGSGGS